MTETDLIQIVLICLAVFSAYHIGKHIGTKETREILRESVRDLEQRVANYNAQLERDPMRAALDQGQRYVLNMLDNFIEQVRTHIDDQRERDERREIN